MQRALHNFTSVRERIVSRAVPVVKAAPFFSNQTLQVATHALFSTLKPFIDILTKPNRYLGRTWLLTAVLPWTAWAAFRVIHKKCLPVISLLTSINYTTMVSVYPVP